MAAHAETKRSPFHTLYSCGVLAAANMCFAVREVPAKVCSTSSPAVKPHLDIRSIIHPIDHCSGLSIIFFPKPLRDELNIDSIESMNVLFSLRLSTTSHL